MAKLHRDPFTQWLEAQGITPGIYQPAGMMGFPPLGWQLVVGRSLVVYRVAPEDPATLIVVLVERQTNRRGIHSPFADLIRFLALLRKSDTGVTHVNGHINAVSWRPKDSLDTFRMKPFYVEHLGGHYFTDSEGTEWVRGSLETAFKLLASRDYASKLRR